MIVRVRPAAVGSILAAAILPIGCGSGPSAPVLTRPMLVSPVNAVAVAQNRPDIGCPFHPGYGHGYQIAFEWLPAQSTHAVRGYDILVRNVEALNPLLETFHGSPAGSTRRVHTSCGSYVADSNLQGWEWRVRAHDVTGNVGEWSELGTFRFEPCRVDGRHCVAR